MNEIHLPTVSGKINPLAQKNTEAELNNSEYLAHVEGTGAVNPTVSEKGNSLGAIVWTRGSIGVYDGTLVGAFPEANTSLFVSDAGGGLDQWSLERDDDDNIQFTAIALGGGLTDVFEVFIHAIVTNSSTVAPTTPEEEFNAILASLDANQTKMWIKIIVRFGGTVTQVDGTEYRKANDYSASSKVIQS